MENIKQKDLSIEALCELAIIGVVFIDSATNEKSNFSILSILISIIIIKTLQDGIFINGK